MLRLRIRSTCAALILVPILATCGGETGPSDHPPTALKLVSGNWSQINNGSGFAAAVQLVDAGGKAVEAPGIAVTVTRTTGSATLSGATTQPTGADGRAVFDGLMLVGATETTQLTFTAESLTSVSSPPFTLKAGSAASLAKVVGDSQTRTTHDTLALRPAVEVRDVGGNPVAGASVNFTVTGGGGGVYSAADVLGATAAFPTVGTGRASVLWRIGNVGTNTLTVSVAGHPEIPSVSFTSAAVPAAPYRYETVSLLGVAPVVDSPYMNAARVTVRDQYGNRVAGAAVRLFNLDSASTTMTFAGGTGTTDSLGEFVLAGWRPGTRSGLYRIAAGTAGGLAPEWTAADYDVKPAAFARVEAPPAILLGRGMFLRFGFRAVDRFGNLVNGIPVSITKLSGAGTFVLDAPNGGDFPVQFTAPAMVDTTVIRATSSLLPDSAFDAVIRTLAPTALRRVSGDSQTVAAGGTPGAPFVVRVVDSTEAPVAEVPVSLVDPNTGSTVQERISDSTGLVSFDPFTQPVGIGFRALDLHTPFLLGGATALRLFVRLVAGPPVAVVQYEPMFGDTIHGDVGAALDSVPMVGVSDGNHLPVEGVVVHFSTTRGQLLGDSAVTDVNGLVSVPGWILDTLAGPQQVIATVGGLAPAQVTVIARPGPVTQLVLLPGPPAEGFVNERLGVGVMVEGRDRYGNLGAGREVTAGVVSGDALALAGSVPLTETGRAYVDLWRLGNTVGGSILRAMVDNGEVTFPAVAAPASPFSIVLRGTLPARYQGYFVRAAYQWRRRITADIPNVNVDIAAGQCAEFQAAYVGPVDDLVIDVSIGAIDGPGAILGGATPCFIRTSDSLPILGVMKFDIADLQLLEAEGTLGDVILHEMGHVLGVGSMWSFRRLLVNSGTANVQYTGAGGKRGWADLGGLALGTTNVPVESAGGPGTAGSHWRESIMPSELMTGYLSAQVNPMSAITVWSLADLGYTVDVSLADPYVLGTAPTPEPGRRGVRIRDLVGRPRFAIDAHGKSAPIP